MSTCLEKYWIPSSIFSRPICGSCWDMLLLFTSFSRSLWLLENLETRLLRFVLIASVTFLRQHWKITGSGIKAKTMRIVELTFSRIAGLRPVQLPEHLFKEHHRF